MLDSWNWTWGLCLIVLTTAIHSLGIVLMSILGLRIRAGLKRRRVAFWQGVAILTGVIAAIGLSLAVLHGIEAALWAAAYLGLGAIDNAAEAMLFSIDSMTTRASVRWCRFQTKPMRMRGGVSGSGVSWSPSVSAS